MNEWLNEGMRIQINSISLGITKVNHLDTWYT